MKLQLTESELNRLLTFMEDAMLRSKVLDELKTKVAALEAAVAALTPGTDFGPQIAALAEAVDGVKQVLDIVDDEAPA